MTLRDPIQVVISPNETTHARTQKLAIAVTEHPAFELVECREIPVDVQFRTGEAHINVELKEPADMVQSVLNGHLTRQVLAMREAQAPAMIVVLGSLKDVEAAIPWVDSNGKRDPKARWSDLGRVRAFAAEAYSVGIPVFYWDQNWEGHLLSHAKRLLQGGNILATIPKPAEGMRQVAALSMLVPGLGPKKAQALIDGFEGGFFALMWLVCRPYTEVKILDSLQEVPGIGPKLATAIMEAAR